MVIESSYHPLLLVLRLSVDIDDCVSEGEGFGVDFISKGETFQVMQGLFQTWIGSYFSVSINNPLLYAIFECKGHCYFNKGNLL